MGRINGQVEKYHDVAPGKLLFREERGGEGRGTYDLYIAPQQSMISRRT